MMKTKYILKEDFEERTIYKLENDNKIYIKNNKIYLNVWSFIYIGIGITLAYMVLKNTTWEKLNWFILFLAGAPFLLFTSVGLVYLNRSRNKNTWIIDPKKKFIQFDINHLIFFRDIHKLYFTYIRSWRGARSHQLNILTKRNDSILLLKSVSFTKLHNLAVQLSVLTSIELDESIYEG